LKKKGYFASITTTWSLIKQEKFFNPSKRAKKARKRNKPNASVTLTSEELKVLYDKGLLGMCSPVEQLNTLWLNNTLHFGLGGCKEHRDMCWGDVKLHKTASGVE